MKLSRIEAVSKLPQFLFGVLLGGIMPSLFASSIEEVIVTAPAGDNRAISPGFELDRDAVLDATPTDLTEVFLGVPAVGVRTNSRGESVIRLRGSEERQTAVFVDGAPISVPWDGRADLSLLPAGIVENIQVIKSAAPAEFGANAVLGAIDVATVMDCYSLCSLRALAGEHGLQNYDLVAGHSLDNLSAVVAASYVTLDGQDAVGSSSIPFGNIVDGQRDNTDSERASVWGAINYTQGALSLRLSHLWVDAERGIAPQGNIDPAASSPRYWRYPEWSMNQTTLNALFEVNGAVELRAVAWYQTFNQAIDQFADDSYEVVTDREENDDQTIGARLGIYVDRGSYSYRLIGNAQRTRHEQLDIDFAALAVDESEIFEQNLYSLGFEFDRQLTEELILSAGLSYDKSTTPETGLRPPQDDLDDWAGSVAINWDFSESLAISASLGQRTRFPTLRELYGESLGSFLLNPGLEPETATLVDVNFDWLVNDNLQLSVSPWYLKLDNTLSRRNVFVDGERFRQRFNLEGSRGIGVDFDVVWSAIPSLDFQLNGSFQRLESEREANGERPDLFQRPKRQINAIVKYRYTDDLSFAAAIQHLGEARDDGEERVETLPGSTQLDLRVFYQFAVDGEPGWRTFVTLENVTNELVLPQLGLPASGRTWRIGIEYRS